MECTRFEELLFDRIEGELEPALSGALDRHAASCQRCAGLAKLTGPHGGEAAEPPAGLTESILARTTGNQQALQRALLRLERDLPQLAEIHPGPAFLAQVMAATIEVDRRRFHARLASWWEGIVRRPRFALEGAYVGSLAIFLLVGLPSSPLAGVPEQLLTTIRSEGRAVRVRVVAESDRVTQLGRATWIRAGNVAGEVGPLVRSTAATTARRWAMNDGAPRFVKAVRETLASAAAWLRTAWLRTTENGEKVPLPDESKDDANSHSA